ncbi:MAG: mevalonate kinase family protein [Promethearchaeota archaeon]
MIKIRAPGRICLFGEHQDYLGFPVIAMAISKYIYLRAERVSEPIFIVNLSDLNDIVEIKLNNKELEYNSNRDYLRSGYNHFLRKGIKFNKGYRITISGDIPINAGVASSSALVMAWLFFLNLISSETLNSFQLANEGFYSEVKEFNEGGGMMDHFISVYGDMIHLKPEEKTPNISEFNIKLDGFVLGNSLEKKDTVEDLIRVKTMAIDAFNALKETESDFDPYKTSLEEIKLFLPNLKKKYQEKIIGNIINRDITIKAKNLILNNLNLLEKQKNSIKIITFYQELGNLLNMHQKQLKENIKVSTIKIDKMISNCMESGALGGKINGSGFGGTMFALGTPGKENLLNQAIEEAGGEAFVIKTSNGVESY